MEILRTVAELRQWSREERNDGENTIGLVPTMGALHAGHASLIRAACASVGSVAVSIFVNPTQFGPNEDYARYPRTFEADCALTKAEGADVVFAPPVEELYPDGAATFVEVEGLSRRLDGASRPGHFCGVATVVAKLLIASEAHGGRSAARRRDRRLPHRPRTGWAGAQLAEHLSQPDRTHPVACA
jgi:pantoate--beta-alanine ligase